MNGEKAVHKRRTKQRKRNKEEIEEDGKEKQNNDGEETKTLSSHRNMFNLKFQHTHPGSRLNAFSSAHIAYCSWFHRCFVRRVRSLEHFMTPRRHFFPRGRKFSLCLCL